MNIFDVFPLSRNLPDFSDFRVRLDYVLAGRRIYPWAASLGISKGAAESMNRGIVPGAEILRTIHNREFVNLSWLVTGEGMPFRIYCTMAAYDLHDIIEDHVRTDIFDKKIHICNDGVRIVIFFSSPGTYDFKGETISFTEWRVYAGSFSENIHALLVSAYRGMSGFDEHQWYHASTSVDELQRILRGELSPVHLFGDGKKLQPLLKAKAIEDIEQTLKPLLEQVQEKHAAIVSSADADVHPDTLCSVMNIIDSYTASRGKIISQEQKSRLYSTIYNHCKRGGVSPEELPEMTFSVLLDMV